jgi:hypothetical protein
VRVPFTIFLALHVTSCAPSPAQPRPDENPVLTTIAGIDVSYSLWTVLGERIQRGRRYAVVDDDGYLGTLRAESELPCGLACMGCCRSQWATKWFEPPARPPVGLVLAIGPVDGRFVSARRELPVSASLEGNPWTWSFVGTEEPQTLARFSFRGGELEARGRRVDGTRVVELRVRQGGEWSVVSRTVSDGKIPRTTLD